MGIRQRLKRICPVSCLAIQSINLIEGGNLLSFCSIAILCMSPFVSLGSVLLEDDDLL
jgi:hypothetical protein